MTWQTDKQFCKDLESAVCEVVHRNMMYKRKPSSYRFDMILEACDTLEELINTRTDNDIEMVTALYDRAGELTGATP